MTGKPKSIEALDELEIAFHNKVITEGKLLQEPNITSAMLEVHRRQGREYDRASFLAGLQHGYTKGLSEAYQAVQKAERS